MQRSADGEIAVVPQARHGFSPGHDAMTLLRQTIAVRRTVEYPCLKLVFEMFDLAPNRRLANPQSLTRLDQSPVINHTKQKSITVPVQKLTHGVAPQVSWPRDPAASLCVTI